MADIALSFRIEKATPEGRFVSGWLSVIEKDGAVVTDTQGDRISMDELAKGVHKYMRGSRVIKKQHSGEQIGEMIEVLIIDDAVAKALGMTSTKRGAWGKAEITDEATRAEVRKGKVTGWSMGGKGKRVPVAKSGPQPLIETDIDKAKGMVPGGSRRLSLRLAHVGERTIGLSRQYTRGKRYERAAKYLLKRTTRAKPR